MPVSASVLVSIAPLSTIATPVVAGLVSDTVHFLAVASFTTQNSAATALPQIAGCDEGHRADHQNVMPKIQPVV